MDRDARSFLWDVRESADAITRFIGERSFDDDARGLEWESEQASDVASDEEAAA